MVEKLKDLWHLVSVKFAYWFVALMLIVAVIDALGRKLPLAFVMMPFGFAAGAAWLLPSPPRRRRQPAKQKSAGREAGASSLLTPEVA